MADEVIAATHGNKAHVYWRNFPQGRWVDFSDAQQHCKLMIFDRQGDYFVKITTEDSARKVFQYLVPRDVQVMDTEGVFQFPVKDPLDDKGGKLIGVRFRDPTEADIFRRKVAAKIGGFSMPAVSGFHHTAAQPSPAQERKVIDHGPSQHTYSHPVQPPTHYSDVPPLPGPGHNVPYQAPTAAPGQQRQDGYVPASQLRFQSEGVRAMGSRPPAPQHQANPYPQHRAYEPLPVNDLSNNHFNVGSNVPPANRADPMVGINQGQQRPFYNQHQQQPPQMQHHHQREGLGGQARYNPPVQPQPPGMRLQPQRGHAGGGMAPSFRDMGPTPRKQNQPFGMGYRHQQQQQFQEQPYLVDPLEREPVQPHVRQQENQNDLAMQLVEAINTGNLDLAQRVTKLLTLDSQKSLTQDSLAASGTFSISWKSFEQPNAQKLHDLEVVVESQKGERYNVYLKVRSEYTFGYLKSICDRQFRIPALSQCWVVNEQVVSDNQTLEEVGITGQATVYIYVMHSVRAKIPEEKVGNLRTGHPGGQGQHNLPPQQDQHPAASSGPAPLPPKNVFQGSDLNNQAQYPVAGDYPLEQSAMYRGAPMGGHRDAGRQQQERGHQEVRDVDIWAMPNHSPNLLKNNHSPDPPNTSQMEVSGLDQQQHWVRPIPPPTVDPRHQLAQIIHQGQPPPLRHPEQFPPAPAPPPPPPKEEPQVGWKCSACTYINKPYRPGCEMCDAARPPDYAPPPGYVPDESEQKWASEAQRQDALFQKMVREENERKERERVENYQRLMQADEEPIVTNEVEFECPVCFIEIPPGDGLRLKSCLHMICKECIKGSIVNSEEVEITCPCGDGCNEPVSEREMRAVLTAEEMQEVHMRGLRKAEAASANSFHCRTTDCPGFCFYEDEVNEFRCQNCGQVNCLLCKAIHEGMNCQEYQEDIKRKANNDDAAKKTQEMLEALVNDGEAMHCPGCKVIVTKKVGCDWIRCSVCKTEMCWATKGPRWGPGGRGDTSGGCRCGLNGKRCIRTCRNCH